ATEMLIREIARKNINKISTPKSKTDLNVFYEKICKKDSLKFKNKILYNDINIKNLIDVFQECTNNNYFDLKSINSINEIRILHDLRNIRNSLIHEGKMFFGDLQKIEQAFTLVLELFKEIYDRNHRLIKIIGEISNIPNNMKYSHIKKLYEEIICVIEPVLNDSKSNESWKVYCYSKLIICFLCNEIIEEFKPRFKKNLLGLYHDFTNYESFDWKLSPEGHFFYELFKGTNYLKIYKSLIRIQEKIINFKVDSDERILNWTELDIIRNLLREKIKNKNIPHDKEKKMAPGTFTMHDFTLHHIDEEKINDEEKFKELLILMTNFGRTRNALLKIEPIHQEWRKKWLEDRRYENKTYEEKEIVLNQLVKRFRENISNDIALNMFYLSLDFSKMHYNRIIDI
ncbi:MAG: hypothetical protein ACTSVV_14025, partial [Promethearchaeota archaeon]